jgi:hypothetical protein
MLRRLHWLGAAVVLLALAVPATAEAKSRRIDHDKGVGGVNLGLKRGPIVVNGHRRNSVHKILGAPNGGIHPIEHGIYLANYTDDQLGVYYQSGGKSSLAKKKRKSRRARSANDRVVGIFTYIGPKGSLSFGTPGLGQTFPDSSADGACAPADRKWAPDNGPPRADACQYDPGSHATDVVYLSQDSQSRAGQSIYQIGIFTPGLGGLIFNSLMAGALEERNCPSYADCAYPGGPPPPPEP